MSIQIPFLCHRHTVPGAGAAPSQAPVTRDPDVVFTVLSDPHSPSFKPAPLWRLLKRSRLVLTFYYDFFPIPRTMLTVFAPETLRFVDCNERIRHVLSPLY